MKVILVLALLLASIKSNSQQVKINDLMGKWISPDTVLQTNPAFYFSDTSDLLLEFWNMSVKATYRIDTLRPVTALYISIVLGNQRKDEQFLIKIESDTLKMQRSQYVKLNEWIPETKTNTTIMVRAK
jgi:hypothetical protein